MSDTQEVKLPIMEVVEDDLAKASDELSNHGSRYERGLRYCRERQLLAALTALSDSNRMLEYANRDKEKFIKIAEEMQAKVDHAENVMKYLSRGRALMIFIEEPEHVQDFMKPVDAYFSERYIPPTQVPK